MLCTPCDVTPPTSGGGAPFDEWDPGGQLPIGDTRVCRSDRLSNQSSLQLPTTVSMGPMRGVAVSASGPLRNDDARPGESQLASATPNLSGDPVGVARDVCRTPWINWTAPFCR